MLVSIFQKNYANYGQHIYLKIGNNKAWYNRSTEIPKEYLIHKPKVEEFFVSGTFDDIIEATRSYEKIRKNCAKMNSRIVMLGPQSLNLDLTRPWTEPIAANKDTIKQNKFNICRQFQALENLAIFHCAMYISIGKYTVIGQNVMAPRRPKNSLKNGNIIARMVVTITYIVLQTRRKKLKS